LERKRDIDMMRDNEEFKPAEGNEELIARLQEKMQAVERKIKHKPKYLKTNSPMFLQTGVSMNDFDLFNSQELQDNIVKNSTMENVQLEIFARLQDIENRLPEFKGLNTFDVPLPILATTATLEEVISTVNKLIQRDVRQDRLK
jgi:hypothetical protein